MIVIISIDILCL